MAALTDGSPTTYATPKATSPANRPASRPLTRKSRAEIMPDSVAWETEQVPPIVHPLMDTSAGEQGRGALFSGDEVHGDQREHPREDQPGQHLYERKGRSRNRDRLGLDDL